MIPRPKFISWSNQRVFNVVDFLIANMSITQQSRHHFLLLRLEVHITTLNNDWSLISRIFGHSARTCTVFFFFCFSLVCSLTKGLHDLPIGNPNPLVLWHISFLGILEKLVFLYDLPLTSGFTLLSIGYDREIAKCILKLYLMAIMEHLYFEYKP